MFEKIARNDFSTEMMWAKFKLSKIFWKGVKLPFNEILQFFRCKQTYYVIIFIF